MANEKIFRFRELMKKYGLDAYVVADADPHSSEYPASYWKTRSWLSGFTGSSGTLVVAQDEAALWTDGRYYIQAEAQLENAGTGATLMRGGEPGVPDYPAWLSEKFTGSAKIGVNGKTTSCAAHNKLKDALYAPGVSIVTEHDLVGEIWGNERPGLSPALIRCHDIRFTGKDTAEKLAEVRAELGRKGASYGLIAGLEDVAWLFNFRGSDIANLPVAYAYAFVAPDSAELYIDAGKVHGDVLRYLAVQGVRIEDADRLPTRLLRLRKGDCICCDPNKLNVWLRDCIPGNVRVVYADEPTLLLKAIKNDQEIEGHRECQIWDGAAMARFMMWIEREARSGAKFTEWDAVLALRGFRAQCDKNISDSFNTIAAYGANGAMMHYSPDEAQSAIVKNAGLMVVDSGGQYFEGTTDVTRTIVFDETTEEERRDFTLTLKSHIALASARFLYGAAGVHIDSIARKVMWDNGLDYKCGTGHGVGCYLSVHEGPQSISMRAPGGARLEEGMIVSIEPGVYREGKHGVRTENLARIAEDFENEFGRFMRFETLTFCPIDLKGVVPEMLDMHERKWLNDYHRAVYDNLSPLLNDGERKWLTEATREI